MIDMHQHREFIDRILARYGMDPSRLEIVDDVREWVLAHGGQEWNPERAAVSGRHPEGGIQIAMRAVHSDELIENVIVGMAHTWPVEEIQRLDPPEAYVAHLVLHEVAYSVLWDRAQRPRDAWAFEQLDACLALRP